MAIVTSILFIIAFISYISGALLCPIGKEEQNRPIQGFQTIIYQCIVLMNITAFAAVIFNKVHIPITLFTTSVFILFLSGILWGIILYKKEKNVIFWSKTDGISMAILIIVVGFISAKMFNFSLEVTYPIQDAANHFASAVNTIQWKCLVNYPFAPYVNACLMSLVQPLFGKNEMYKTFILTDIIFHIFEILIVYSIFADISKKKISKMASVIFSIIYFMGYPYLCFTYGFIRQQRALLLVLGIVYCILKKKKHSNIILFYTLILIQLFNILESYPLYLAQAGTIVVVNFFFLYKKRIINFFRSNIGKFTMFFGGTLAIAISYVVYLKFNVVKNNLSEAGGTYFSPYSDLIYFIPPIIIVIVVLWKSKRKKRTNLICANIIIACVAVTMVEFILWWNGMMSSYYYYKAYSILWFVGWLASVYAIEILEEKKQTKELLFYGGIILSLCLIQGTKINTILVEKDSQIENGSMRTNYYNLLAENYSQISEEKRKNYFPNDIEDAYAYMKKYYEKENICYIATEKERNTYVWLCVASDVVPYEISSESTDINEINNVGNYLKIDCIMINKLSTIYLKNQKNIEQMKCIYQNDTVVLIQKDGEEW